METHCCRDALPLSDKPMTRGKLGSGGGEIGNKQSFLTPGTLVLARGQEAGGGGLSSEDFWVLTRSQTCPTPPIPGSQCGRGQRARFILERGLPSPEGAEHVPVPITGHPPLWATPSPSPTILSMAWAAPAHPRVTTEHLEHALDSDNHRRRTYDSP